MKRISYSPRFAPIRAAVVSGVMFWGFNCLGTAAVYPGLVLGKAEVKGKSSSEFSELLSDRPVTPGSTIRTGVPGEVMFDLAPQSRITLQQDSEVQLQGVAGTRREYGISSSNDSVSAIKSIFTLNSNAARLTKTLPPAADLTLTRGSLISSVENSSQRIDIPLGYVYATGGGFVTTVENPTTTRVTVHDGFVTVGLPDGKTLPVGAGQFVRLKAARNRNGFEIEGPATIGSDQLALADMAYFEDFGGKKGLLEPVGEFIEEPGVFSDSGVGTGSSAPPYDLSSPGNERNLITGVISDEQ